MKQPFDLEKALAGHPLVTRDGSKTKNFKVYDDSEDYTHSCCVDAGRGIYVGYAYKSSGKLSEKLDSSIDLFLYVPDQPEPTNDNVKHPSHYTQGKIEVIDFIQDQQLNYARGNAIKYIIRAGLKSPATTIEDLEKAKQYIDFEINDLKRKNNDNMEQVPGV